MLIISAGLQKSGSALIFNILNDILKEKYDSDTRNLKSKYGLDEVLKYFNCNVEDLSWRKIKPLFWLSRRYTFVIKTHSSPTGVIKLLHRIGMVKTILIIRDPRDVTVSAMDHGMRLRVEGRTDAFASCTSLQATLPEVKSWIRKITPWLTCNQIMIIKYEDLINQQKTVLRSIFSFLGIFPDEQLIEVLYKRYDPIKPDISVRNHLHYNKAIIGRFREVLTSVEQELITKELENEMLLLGY